MTDLGGGGVSRVALSNQLVTMCATEDFHVAGLNLDVL